MLPKIDQPLYKDTLPSSGKNVYYRPFLAKEEKILLMAKEAGDNESIISAVVQVVLNCLHDVDQYELTNFDIEYFFIKIRSKSVSNIANIKLIEDEIEYSLEIDLDQVIIKRPDEAKNTINISDDITISLKYPSMIRLLENSQEDPDYNIDLLMALSIDNIIQGENINDLQNTNLDELIEWIGQIPMVHMKEIRAFIYNHPKPYYELKYFDQKGMEKIKILSALSDFFISL